MKKIFFIISVSILTLVFTSCSKDEVSPEIEDPKAIKAKVVSGEDWDEIKIPNQKYGVSAICGSIDDTLIVALHKDILISTNRGRSWFVTGSSVESIRAIYRYKDELVAFSGFSISGSMTYATLPKLYSLDNGKTWTSKGKYSFQVYRELRIEYNRVSSSSNEYFTIKQDFSYKYNGFSHFKLLPYLLIHIQNGIEKIISFPYRRYIESLHRDRHGFLYLGCDGTMFDSNLGQGGMYKDPERNDEAIIYCSKKK